MNVEVKNLVKHFGHVKAVDDISFSFSPGQIFGFIGPNGAGKTTTIRIMATLDSPTSGDVFFNGISVVEEPEKIRHIVGYMPDSLPTHSDITVHEYLDFFARAYGVKNPTRKRLLSDITEFTKLISMGETFLKTLSKGMKQRVSLARALIHDPHVLIMDEPAAGLDPRARVELRELLKILADQGKSILMSSHILTELEDICHGTVIIEKGKILYAGNMKDVLSPTEIQKTNVFVRSRDEQKKLLTDVLQMPHVEKATPVAHNEIRVLVTGADRECSELLAALIQSNVSIVEFRQEAMGLEEVFMNITRGEVQ